MLLNGVLLSCWSELCKSCTVFVVCLVFSFYYFIHIIIVMAAEHGSATGSDAERSLHALAPQPARDAAEVALHDADHVHVLNAGATAAVDNSGQAKQQG